MKLYHSGVKTRSEAQMILQAGDSIMSSFAHLTKDVKSDKAPELFRALLRSQKLRKKD
jgi:hypothetical protein